MRSAAHWCEPLSCDKRVGKQNEANQDHPPARGSVPRQELESKGTVRSEVKKRSAFNKVFALTPMQTVRGDVRCSGVTVIGESIQSHIIAFGRKLYRSELCTSLVDEC